MQIYLEHLWNFGFERDLKVLYTTETFKGHFSEQSMSNLEQQKAVLSFHSLSYDMSIASSKSSSPHNAI